MELKEEHRRKQVSKELTHAIGHVPTTAKEKRVHAASAAILTGAKVNETLRDFAINSNEVNAYIEKAFPDENERFKFLEQCATGCAIKAQERFLESYKEMTPEGAARSFGIFADKALAIKKARESNFAEPQINVAVLVQLQETLKKLTVTETDA